MDLSVPAGTSVSLLGPSGSGKTTLLRVVAGLQPLTEGTVLLGGRDLAPIPVHQRGVGLMFQDFALFPHRDVGGNVAFGLRMTGQPEPAVRQRVGEVLDLVGLPGIERRRIATLSGGEQQRVALARALAPRPRILLLDEPMGSLDRSLRERLPLELRELFERLGLTVVYVTHDQDEALAVADRTVVLHDGVIEADAESEALWARPPTAFVARFLGYRNVAAARRTVEGIDTPWGRLSLASPEHDATAVGSSLSVLLRPEGVSIAPVQEAEPTAPPPCGWRGASVRRRHGPQVSGRPFRRRRARSRGAARGRTTRAADSSRRRGRRRAPCAGCRLGPAGATLRYSAHE